MSYADAIGTADTVTIEGVRVPFLSLEMLIKSKTTCREQDRAGFGAAARPAASETPARKLAQLRKPAPIRA